jgi:hypothetical protein
VRKEEHLRIFLHRLSFDTKVLSKKKFYNKKNPDSTARILENILFFDTEVV